jgi:hypothetical protein
VAALDRVTVIAVLDMCAMTSTCALVPGAFVLSVSVAVVKVIGMVPMLDGGVAASGVMRVTGVVRVLAVGCLGHT